MKIKQVDGTVYRVSFKTPFNTARGLIAERVGIIVRVQAGNGLIGLGEAAPLPEFGGGTLDDVVTALLPVVQRLVGKEVEELAGFVATLCQSGEPGAAAAAFSLDTAMSDLLAQEKQQSLSAWLLAGSSLGAAQVPTSPVAVNATLGAINEALLVRLARQAIEQGYSCLKLKVGELATTGQEIARVRAVREAIGPGPALRLDANGAWTVEQALEVLPQLARFDIELVEQPVAPGNLAGMAAVRREGGIAVAADEAVSGVEAARRIIEAGAADVLVIKPMVVGGLQAGRQIIELAHRAGLAAYVTSNLDAGVAIAAALHLAATLPDPARACGLGTAALLDRSLVIDLPPVEQGRMRLTTGPGLGVTLDEATRTSLDNA